MRKVMGISAIFMCFLTVGLALFSCDNGSTSSNGSANIVTDERLIGTWIRSDQTLTFKTDGTYEWTSPTATWRGTYAAIDGQLTFNNISSSGALIESKTDPYNIRGDGSLVLGGEWGTMPWTRM